MNDDIKVRVINESDSKSILSDIVTFALLLICFSFNYHFLGDSVVLQMLLAICFFVLVYGQSTKKIKRMNKQEAIEYFMEKAEKEEDCKFHETRIRMNCGILDDTCADCEEKDCSLNKSTHKP